MVGIIEWDVNLRVSRWNHRAESIFGYRCDEVIGRHGGFLVPDSSAERLNAAWQDILSNAEGSTYQGQALHANGTLVTINWFNMPLTNELGERTGVISLVQDLTEYRSAIQTLARTTELLERTGEMAKVGGWQLEIPTQKLTWTTQTFCIADLDPSQEPPLADGINLFAPEARPVISQAIAAAIEHGKPYDLELPWISAKGRHLWVRTQGFAEMDGGRPIRLFGTIKDITERKLASDAAIASERRFRAIIEAAPTPMALNDAAQNITFLNPAFTRVFGYTQDDIPNLAAWWPKAYPNPEYRRWVAETWHAELVRAEKPGTPFAKMALLIIAKDGSERYVQASAAPILDGLNDAHLVVLEDVTAAKIAEENLRAADHQLTVLINSTDGIVWEADVSTFDFTTVSKNVERVLGYPQEDWLQPGFWALHIHPEDRDQAIAFCAMQTRLARDHDFEYRFIAADGRIVWLRDKVTVITEAGQPRWLRGLMTNVSVEKQAAIALRESENRWKFAIEGSGEGLWDWNISAGTVYFTPRWKEMLGFDDDEIGNDFEEWRKRVHPDDLSGALADVQSHLAGLTAHSSSQFRMLCKDGSWKWILARRLVITRDASGAPTRMIGTHTDISERRATDEKLRTNAMALDSISQGVLITDNNRRIVSANTAFSNITGYTEQEIIGRNCDFLHGLLTTPEAKSQIRNAVSDGVEFNGPIVNYRKDGTAFWNDLTLSPVRDAEGTLTHYVGVHRDITERKKAEESLRISAAALKNISQGVLITNADLLIVSANIAFSKITGYAEEEMIGRDCKFLQGPLSEKETMVQISQSIQAGREFDGEILNYRKDGNPFWNHLTISPIRNAEGDVVQYIGITRDVTESKRAEEKRVALEEQLRESQKMEAIGTLAGGIAHDFNNILAAVQGNTVLAMEDVAANPRALESLAEIEKATSRARDLVRQILSFSRRQPTALTNMSLVPVAEESVRLLRATMPPRLSLRLDIAENLPNVAADGTQIEQVLINLATNAMQAMREGRGQIEIILDTVVLDDDYVATHPQALAMLTARPGRTVRLRVSDNGPGMDADTRTRVFEPFFTTKPVGEGTGLGLSVVHGIAQKHEGVIFLDSELGRGTTFTLLLPASNDSVATTTSVETKESSLQVHAGRHILYLDDDEALVFLCGRLFERRGHRVTTFTSQNEALEALRADPYAFDVLVTDYNMPGASGLDVARAALAIRPDLPIGVASGFVDEALQAEAVEAGVYEVILKASDVNEFCETVTRLANKVGGK